VTKAVYPEAEAVAFKSKAKTEAVDPKAKAPGFKAEAVKIAPRDEAPQHWMKSPYTF